MGFLPKTLILTPKEIKAKGTETTDSVFAAWRYSDFCAFKGAFYMARYLVLSTKGQTTMTITKKAQSFIAALLCAGLMAGCSDKDAGSSGGSDSLNGSDNSVSESVPENASDSADTEQAAPTSDADAPESEEVPPISSPESVRVMALSGPTAMGLTKLMDRTESEDLLYDFTIATAVDEISPMIIQGNTDICCVPANLGAVLCNKTEGGVEVLAVNTLGVLYLCENGNTVAEISDLRGKTIYSSGKGATPEYALNYILSENGINPETDVTIEWKSEHAECVAALSSDEDGVAMLPQPFATVAQSQNENINVVIDLNEEWDKLENGSALITGAVIARTEFVEQYPEAVYRFLSDYMASVDFVNNNVAEASQLVEKYGIINAAVAEKAIPKCNIVCITGEEMKDKLSGYLNVLFEQNPQAVGGAVPADSFYYAYEFPG